MLAERPDTAQEVDNLNETLELKSGLERTLSPVCEEAAVDPRSRLLQSVREIAGLGDLEFDQDGDIGVRYASALVFVRLSADSSHVNLFARLLAGIDETLELLNRLNEINAGSNNLRVFAQSSAVVAVCDLPAQPLVHEHLEAALHEFCPIADGIGGLLQSEFGGETWFAETMPSVLKH